MSLMDFIKRKKTDTRITEASRQVDNIITNAISNGRYSMFEFNVVKEALEKCEMLNDYEKYEFFYSLILGWDRDCKLDRKTGELINQKMNSLDSILAIHRTDLGLIEDRNGLPYNYNLDDIMSNGLINNGHAMQGAYIDNPSLALTTSPVKSLGDLINVVGSYKHNNATILLEFPKSMVEDDLSFVNDEIENSFYNRDKNDTRIDPNYILGVIVKNDNGLDRFYSKEELLSKSMMI